MNALAVPPPLSLPPVKVPADGISPVDVYLASVADGTRRGALQRLERFTRALTGGHFTARQLPWHQLRNEHLIAGRTRLVDEGMAISTVNVTVSCVRAVLKTAWRQGLMSIEELHRACDLKPLRGSSLPRGRGLAAGELRALFDTCAKDKGPSGVRDAALLAVLYGAGLRRAETVSLDLEDYDSTTGGLKVLGKGGKERMVFLPAGARAAVHAWLDLRGDLPGPLFLRCSRRVVNHCHGRLTDQAVYAAVGRRQKQAGVENFSPHDLRRSYVSDLLDAGADTIHVQKLVGHSSPTTTSRYDRRPEEAKRKAAELLHVPFCVPVYS